MRAASLLSLLLIAGCNNPCQALCEDMATIADECGTEFSEAEINSCVDDFAAPSKEDRQTCNEYGGLDVLRQNWTCDDINLYRESLSP